MALINCPECKKEISDKATSCPNCGLPLNQIRVQPQDAMAINNVPAEEISSEIIPCPEFPSDLRIGQQITNWSFDAAFKGVYDQSVNTITDIPSGSIQVLLHTHGLRVMSGLNIYDIHNSQIINIQKTSSAAIAQANKSVIGRAVVGGLIMGPLGAIIGGISGTGTKDKLMVTQYAVINFWDIKTKTPQSLLIVCDNDQTVDAFIIRQIKEAQKNIEENRPAEQESFPIWAVICIICIIFGIIMFFVS